MLAGWRRLREEIGLAVADQATTDPGTMEELWRIRRGVEPMLSEMAGRRVPVGFVEDTAVPVERLAEHLRGLYKIFDAHGVQAAAYGHASLGHLHVRPFLDLTDPVDRRHMQQIAAEVFEHTKQLRGTMSAEHGDGLLRTEFLPDFYGRAYEAMVAVKRLFDPEGILNPGKKTGAEAGEMIRHLRPRGVAP
jgi:FAD/FMN-containing dehydrogenase